MEENMITEENNNTGGIWSEYDEHEFTAGEVFLNEYPPQAAIWCNETQTHYIEELEPIEEATEEGEVITTRRWQIKAVPVPTPEELAQQEAERVAMLNLTAADVERAIYKAKGMDFEDVIAQLEAMPLTEGQSPVVDIKALKIELKANNFYRGNPYIDIVGTLLGFSKEQLDEFFETNDYTKLLPAEEDTSEAVGEDDPNDGGNEGLNNSEAPEAPAEDEPAAPTQDNESEEVEE